MKHMQWHMHHASAQMTFDADGHLLPDHQEAARRMNVALLGEVPVPQASDDSTAEPE
jgi:hypothetical protein